MDGGLSYLDVNLVSPDLHRVYPQGQLRMPLAGTGCEIETVAVARAGEAPGLLEHGALQRRELVRAFTLAGVNYPLGLDQQHLHPADLRQLLPPIGHFRK